MRPRHGLSLACLVGAACLAAAAPTLAAKGPAVLSPTFKDNLPVTFAGSACTVRFTELKDGRRDPTLVGIFGNRTVRAPEDTQAWLRAVVGGLTVRGVDVQYDAAADGASDPVASFSLQIAWIQPRSDNLSANVAVTIDAAGANGRSVHQTYRGTATNLNWAATAK